MPRSLLTSLFVTLAMLAVVIPRVHAQKADASSGDDQFTGVWELAISESHFSRAPNIISRTITIEPTEDGMRQEIETVTNRYETLRVIYDADFDGSDSRTIGPSGFTNISLKRMDDGTVERMGKIQGQVVETCMMSVSDDGETLTLEIKGPTYESMQVYHRDSDAAGS